MAVRSTMAALISRVRTLINDPAGAAQNFTDDDIQAVMDESRLDLRYLALTEMPSYVNGTLSYLDYYMPKGNGNLEDGMTLWQYLTVQVTPSSIEPIVGHFQFAASTPPPIYVIGFSYDIYRAAADLLERLSMRFALQFDFSSDGQSFHVSQAFAQIQKTVLFYRQKQRVMVARGKRTDLTEGDSQAGNGGPVALDYFSSGNPGG